MAGEILSLTCTDETFSSGLIYSYCGGSDAHHKIDELSATTGTAFLESEDQKIRAVFNLTETYRTICSAPIIGAFGNGTGLNMRAYLMRQYVDFLVGESTSIKENNVVQVTSKLGQNYPNPFKPSGAGHSPTTTISFNLIAENAELEIYNMKGQKVKQLVNEQLPAGQHSVVWNGMDDSGKSVSSGIYFYKMKSGNYTSTKKMILLK
ncbi:MAG: T9SS type A sorting domain-containing protein [Candidatus Cloacimonetes bacterium]|nr:T9SS type A sorting domain-containing protein [Candidatus Cloacimonadota bacterium]